MEKEKRLILPPGFGIKKAMDEIEKIKNKEMEEIFKRISKIIELQYFINIFKNLKELGEIENLGSDYFANLFYKKFVEKIAQGHHEMAILLKDQETYAAREVKNFVLGLGAKFYAVSQVKLCVTTEREMKCRNCFFVEACTLPKKN